MPSDLPAAVPPEDVLRRALLAAPVAAVALAPGGIVTRVNPAWARLFGGQAEDAVGRPFASLVGAEVAAHFGNVDPFAAVAPTTALVPGADGALHPVELIGVPLLGLSGGQVVVYARAIGDGPSAAHADAPEAIAIPDAVFDGAPVGMGIFDAAFRFVRVNAALAATFDLPAEELVGRSYAEFLHPTEREPAANRMQAARQGALSSGEIERRFVSAKGRSLWIHASGVRLPTSPAHTYFGIFSDVTERREAIAERALLQRQVAHAERLRTLGQLAAGIAHEINNPAAIAIGGVDLARRRLATALTATRTGDLGTVRKQLEHLEAALRYCEDGTLRVAQAASRLGSFSSLRSGRLDRTDPNEVIRRAVALVRNELRHRAHLVVELGDPPSFVAYTDRLVQAVTNLLVNAGQAVEGRPDANSITIRTWSEPSAACISVTDTGIGMSREVRERLFEPFFTSRGKDRGTGLGLTVVRDVVSEHRGEIDVTSEPGRGSCFTLRLPIDNGLELASAEVQARAGRVLVVDDEPFVAAVLTEILQANHDVVCVSGGREALALLEKDTAFDALLCDLMMPDVDGIEIHTWLREHAPALAERTVFCTGGAFTQRARSYLAQTRLAALAKPFTADDVLRSVQDALGKSEKR